MYLLTKSERISLESVVVYHVEIDRDTRKEIVRGNPPLDTNVNGECKRVYNHSGVRRTHVTWGFGIGTRHSQREDTGPDRMEGVTVPGSTNSLTSLPPTLP